MKKLKAAFGVTLLILLVATAYFIFWADNVYVRLSSNSLNRKNVFLKAWIDDKLIFNDSLETDPTGRKRKIHAVKIPRGKSYLMEVQVNANPKTAEKIMLNWFTLVYVTVSESSSGDIDEATINSYTLKEAWDMNLLTGEKE